MLASHMPRLTDNPDCQSSDVFIAILLAEADQSGWRLIGHVAREFERVTLSAPRDVTTLCKKRRHNMQHAGDLGHDFNLALTNSRIPVLRRASRSALSLIIHCKLTSRRRHRFSYQIELRP